MRYGSRTKQKGVAVLLAVILVGFGTLAMVHSIFYDARNIQGATTAVHKVTQSQARAWKGAELVRLGMQALPTTDLNNLKAGKLTITGVDNIDAKIISNTEDMGGRKINIVLQASGADDAATTTLNLVYLILPAQSPVKTVNSTIVANIKGDLKLGGDTKFFPSLTSGVASLISVDGAVDISGSVQNLDQLCSTGDMSLNGNNSVKSVCTNGNLTVNGSASVTNSALVKGDVQNNGSGRISNIISNGNVTTNNGPLGSVSTKGDVTIGGDSKADYIETESNVTWSSSNAATSKVKANGYIIYSANSPRTTLTSKGNVVLNSNGNVSTITSGGDVTIRSNWNLGVQGNLQAAGEFNWASNIRVNNGVVGRKISPSLPAPSWAPPVNVTRTNGYSPVIAAVSVPVVNNNIVPMMKVDVCTLESSANFVFKIDNSGMRKVEVKNMNGITDGIYYLGNYTIDGKSQKDYLCTSVNSSGNCVEPTNPNKTICSDQQNGCVTYTPSTQSWTVDGRGNATIVPGVAYFDGNLNVSNGVYFNTWLASGNLTTSGQTTSYSVNFAGYKGVCTNATDKGRNPTPVLANIYPKNYCDITSSILTPQPIGNSVYVAGCYKNNVFSGGDISIGNTSKQYGSVFAGNSVAAGGATDIYGQIVAAGQGKRSTNNFSGSLKIDLQNVPTTVNTSTAPCMGGNCGNSSTQTQTPAASIIWSSYE